ncbi:unnamed protein product [Caretta caretta]
MITVIQGLGLWEAERERMEEALKMCFDWRKRMSVGPNSLAALVQEGTNLTVILPGQLYALAIEPFLCLLRRRLTGLALREPELRLVLSAYADDVLLVVQDPGDLARVEACQAVYSAASSARVNWVKSSGLVLYALAIEPFLCLLRRRLTGLALREPELRLVLSAYADDVLLVVQDPGDLARVEACQAVYSAASSARVNWVKSSGLVLYALAIEPFLCLLRRRLTGLALREPELRLVLSAYADDVLLVVQDPGDLARVEACQAVYSAASSARVNWVKSSGLVLYALAIEPFLCLLRRRLTGLALRELELRLVLSAYADDVLLVVQDPGDLARVEACQAVYSAASSARVNWVKSSGLVGIDSHCKVEEGCRAFPKVRSP